MTKRMTRAAVLVDKQKLALEERPIPPVGPGDALVKVEVCGICGSDLHSYATGDVFPLGTVMGHEAVGTVLEVGESVRDIRPGDRVALFGTTSCGTCSACRRGLEPYCFHSLERTVGDTPLLSGAYAEYLWLPFADQMLVTIPDGLSCEAAALANPVATALHAVRLSSFKPGDTVAVLGAGPIGLLTIHLLALGGAAKILATEISPQRSAAARALGAALVLHPEEEKLGQHVAELTDGVGADVVFECSGVPAAFQQSLEVVRPAGQIIALGLIERETRIVPLDMVLKEICIKGSISFSRREFEQAIDLLAQGRISTEWIISQTIALHDIEDQGFRRLLSIPDVVKILVKP
jgi:(R,R)-butanediol dehydrogenase/meso-butanediol dehydrogenase/diacetyl reductase